MNKDENPGNRKIASMAEQCRDFTGDELTTDQGVRVNDNQNTLTAGARGPSLLEDFIMREKLTHFDHERIPERVVHARGSGAHGVFRVYESMADVTCAKFLQDPSIETPVFVRFSTVVGFRGSSDTVRDVRGFATKFYTDDGIFDLVGNNMPVFFIQDAIKFPDLVHAIKPEPHNEIPQASAAHNNFWDFISLMPESMHMIMWVLSDRALPKSYRMMDGFGVHTFKLINADNKTTFVKWHWRALLGAHSLTWDETQKIAGKDPDFNRRDLWNAIEKGNFPEYELCVQLFDEQTASTFDFDILDATKIVPEELVPLRRVGKMTLTNNPNNFFAETEQVAFCPANIVPGIDFTDDPLLQGRLFSYLDTQLTRLGGPNFAQIPINRPLNKVQNNHQDGFMRIENMRRTVNYEPNSLGGGCPMQSPDRLKAFMSQMQQVEGPKVRHRSESFSDHYSQATLFWNSQSEAEKLHLIDAIKFELSKVDVMHIRERMVGHFNEIDHELAAAVAPDLGVDTPAPSRTNHGKRSAALSLTNTIKSAKTRQIAILAASGVNGNEVKAVVTALARIAGVKLTATGELTEDKGVLTGARPEQVADALVKALAEHRFWNRDMKDSVPA